MHKLIGYTLFFLTFTALVVTLVLAGFPQDLVTALTIADIACMVVLRIAIIRTPVDHS